MSDPLDMTGKTVLVTGSGRNIGRSIILEFAANGANVIVNTRSNKEEARKVVEAAEELGSAAIAVEGDAADPQTIRRIQSQAEKAFGGIDIYVSNGARRLHRSFFDTTDEDWHRYLNQQLTASWYLAKALVPYMQEQGWGRIIHMNGPDGWLGGWSRVPHSTAKGGLRTLTKSLASGLGEFGITVNDVNPGYVNTQRDIETHPEEFDNEHISKVKHQLPIQRRPNPEEIAWACLFLCSPRSDAITGTVLHADGGYSMFG